MNARTLVDCHINDQPVKTGTVVQVDANTLRNLIRDGKLEAYVEPEPESQPEVKPVKPRK